MESHPLLPVRGERNIISWESCCRIFISYTSFMVRLLSYHTAKRLSAKGKTFRTNIKINASKLNYGGGLSGNGRFCYHMNPLLQQ